MSESEYLKAHKIRKSLCAAVSLEQKRLYVALCVAGTETFCTHSSDVNSSWQYANIHQIVDDATMNVT